MRYGSQVTGWYHDAQGERLVELAKNAPGEIVELGTAWGKSISYILAGTDRSVTCVDRWDGGGDSDYSTCWDMFNELLDENGWQDRVNKMRMLTNEAALIWNRPIGLLHIDASHDYDDVLADFKNWSPYVAEGGAIAFDDYAIYPGVTRVVIDHLQDDPEWEDKQMIHVQWSARRVSHSRQTDMELTISEL